MGRAPCCDKIGMKKGKWTAEEDEKLVSYIRNNGEGSWRSLPKNAGLLRCGKSCRLRWINYLKDDLKRGNISPEEESTIIKLQAELGNRWSLIANSLPGRTDNGVKNHWNSHLSRRIQSELNKDAAPPVKKKRGRKPKPKPTKEGSCSGSDSGLKQMEFPPETITTTKETKATPTSSEGSTEKAPEETSSGEDGGGLIDFDMGDFNLEDLWNDVDNNIITTTTNNNNNSSSYNIEDDDLWLPPFPQTAAADCLVEMGQAPCCDKIGMNKGKWTAEEDGKLVSYIRDNGEGSWRSLPKKAGLLRRGMSCRLRWFNYLKDDLKRGNISPEEEDTIIRLQAQLGNRWSSIVNSLPGRTDNEIKNYWNSHLRRRVELAMNKDAPPPVKKKRGRKPKPRPTVETSGSKEIQSSANSTITNETESSLPVQQDGDGVLLLHFDGEEFLLNDDLWHDVDVNNDIMVTDNNNHNNVGDGQLVLSPLPLAEWSADKAAAEVNGVINWDDGDLIDFDVLKFEPMLGPQLPESGLQWGGDQEELNLDWCLDSDFCTTGADV